MSRVRVKICGITSLEDLKVAIEAGADAVGFIVDVPQSPRNLPIRKAQELIRAPPVFVETVTVTVPRNLNRLEKICKMLNPDLVQVHGSSVPHKEIRECLLDRRLIGVVQAEPNFTVDTALEAAKIFDAVLVDSHVPDMYGGTGKTHDWELSRRVRDAIDPKPLILAGGLTLENVKEAIRLVKPYAVDVSSGVESHPGIKDRNKVFEFIKRAKEV
jgi:phosphoribosylanthranilate isomerase